MGVKPGSGKVDQCTVIEERQTALSSGSVGTLTCGTQGLAFWMDDGLSCRWPYHEMVSVRVAPGGIADDSGARAGEGTPFLISRSVLQLARGAKKFTGRVRRYSLITLAMRECSLTLQTASVTLEQVEAALAPALGRRQPLG